MCTLLKKRCFVSVDGVCMKETFVTMAIFHTSFFFPQSLQGDILIPYYYNRGNVLSGSSEKVKAMLGEDVFYLNINSFLCAWLAFVPFSLISV